MAEYGIKKIQLHDDLRSEIENKVNSDGTKVLSDNDFTSALKNAYDNIVTWVSTNGTNLINHLTNSSNPHGVTKSQVGLSNVDNTSDVSKPVSTAQAATDSLRLLKGSYTGTADDLKTAIIDVPSTTLTLSDTHNGKVLLFSANCAVTIPNTLSADFNCVLNTKNTSVLTIALGSGVALINNTGYTLYQTSSFSLLKIGTTNNFLTAGAL